MLTLMLLRLAKKEKYESQTAVRNEKMTQGMERIQYVK